MTASPAVTDEPLLNRLSQGNPVGNVTATGEGLREATDQVMAPSRRRWRYDSIENRSRASDSVIVHSWAIREVCAGGILERPEDSIQQVGKAAVLALLTFAPVPVDRSTGVVPPLTPKQWFHQLAAVERRSAELA